MELIFKLLESDDDRLEKRGLQDLCDLLEKGYLLKEEEKQLLFIRLSKLKKSGNILVRRWLYKSIGLLKEMDFLPYLKGQLTGIEDDLENQTWIIAALYHLLEESEAVKIITKSNLSSNTDLFAGFYEPSFLPKERSEIKKILDKNDPLLLKWFSLLYGNSLNSFRIEKPKLKDLLTRLNLHDDYQVVEYSVWALHKSKHGRFTDCQILPHQIFNHKPNVRRWLYRLLTKDVRSITVNFDLIKTAIDNEKDTSAREGLAIGLGEFCLNPEISQLYFKWFIKEKNSFVRIQLLRNIAENVLTSNNFKDLIIKEIQNPFDIISRHIAETCIKENNIPTVFISADKKLENSETQMKESLPTIVILTAILEEYEAVRYHLKGINDADKNDTGYEEGIFKTQDKSIARVIIRECGAKNVIASQEAERAINNFKPQMMLFVGIAGSRKPQDFNIGDVIFPEKIYSYQGGKAGKNSFLARPDLVESSYTLYEIAKKERTKDDWKCLIKGSWEVAIKARLGVIASGEQLIEHYDSTIGKILTKFYNDTQVVEMEGFGFAKAVSRQGRETGKILLGVVRGISDILEHGDSQQLDVNRRPEHAKLIASDTAAAFAYWLIYKTYA